MWSCLPVLPVALLGVCVCVCVCVCGNFQPPLGAPSSARAIRTIRTRNKSHSQHLLSIRHKQRAAASGNSVSAVKVVRQFATLRSLLALSAQFQLCCR
jgi:hypothetical protein